MKIFGGPELLGLIDATSNSRRAGVCATTTPIPAAIPVVASSNRLIFGWSLHMIDDEDLDRTFLSLQPEPELLLNGREKSGTSRVRSR